MKDSELLELCDKFLNYDPETGVFTWKSVRGPRAIGSKSGCNHKGYVRIKLSGVSYLAHRLAFLSHYGFLPEFVDHINSIKDDNRIINLRSCTRSQNGQNRGPKSDNTSGYKGVLSSGKKGRWQAKISINGRETHLGVFDCKHKAALSYNEAAKIHHGEFAYLNTIAKDLFTAAMIQNRLNGGK